MITDKMYRTAKSKLSGKYPIQAKYEYGIKAGVFWEDFPDGCVFIMGEDGTTLTTKPRVSVAEAIMMYYHGMRDRS